MSDTPTLTVWQFDEDDWEIACPRCMETDGVYMPMQHGGREIVLKRDFMHNGKPVWVEVTE